MTTHVELELARQPEAWRAAAAALAAAPRRAPAPRASASRSSGAARRCTWRGPTPSAARGGRPRRDRRLPGVRVPLRPDLRPRRGDHPVRHHDRGAAGARASRSPTRRPRSVTVDEGTGDRRSSPATRSPCRWRPRSRWCRPCSPPPSSPCCARRSARTSRASTAAAERALTDAAPGRPDASSRSPSSALGWAGGDRRGGGAQVPRGRRLLDRVLPGDGVPPRPDQRQRAGHVVWVFGDEPDGLRSRRTRPPARPTWRAATTRWPTWSAPSASPSPSPTGHGRDPDRPRSLTFSVVLDQPGS